MEYDFSEEFRRRVEPIFQSEFGIEHPTIPIQWDDVPFNQPKNGPWVAFTIMENKEEQVSLGRKMVVRTSGFIQIDVIYPKDTGRATVKKLANFAANIFAYRKFKAETVSISFFEKHTSSAPTKDSSVRVMARIFFSYDGERVREGVQHIS